MNAASRGEGAATDPSLAAGIKAIHREAQGVLGLDIIRREDMPDVIGAAVAGDARALMLFRAVCTTLERIKAAPTADPLLCASCPKALNDGNFAVVVASPTDGHPAHGLALCVCTGCATSVPDITTKAAALLRSVWPDLRSVTIGGATGHA